MTKVCKICGLKHYGLGLCKKHYMQNYNHGSTFKRTMYDPNEIIVYDDYAEIILYDKKGMEKGRTKIDLDVIDKCKQYKWCLNHNGYVMGNINNKKIGLHQFVLNRYLNIDDFKDMDIDHIDGILLNNMKVNLRKCTHKHNSSNLKISCNNTSGVSGVSFYKKYNIWVSYINTNYKRIHLGSFKTKDEAIKAREEAEIKYFGEFRRKIN